MLRARARGGLTAVVVPLALLGVVLSGCGAAGGSAASAEDATPALSEKTVDCRAQWKKLSEQAADHEAATPSALPQRWVSVAATADYYATSGTATDCGDTLSGQRTAITTLTAFGKKLEPFDLELRLARVQNAADDYANSPRPAPTKQKAAKGKPARSVPAPAPKAIAAALKTLQKQAPLASRQQDPAWQQAEVTELGDTKAVAKALKDLGFLSRESAAYRAGSAALARIQTAVKLAG